MQRALDALKVKLTFTSVTASLIKGAADFVHRLSHIFEFSQDALLCLNWGKLTGQPEKNWGHFLALDLITPDDIRLIGTGITPKWRRFPFAKAFNAVILYDDSNYSGIWVFASSK